MLPDDVQIMKRLNIPSSWYTVRSVPVHRTLTQLPWNLDPLFFLGYPNVNNKWSYVGNDHTGVRYATINVRHVVAGSIVRESVADREERKEVVEQGEREKCVLA